MGDRGYLVTFERTDPFFTLDLSTPSAPVQVGELEIPGFSSYLHPISSNLLVGVGQDADEEGVTVGTQIALFDVSDFSQPKRIQSLTIENAYSRAEWDHKAFRYLDASKLLILPLSVYDKGNEFDGFRVFSVNEDTGIAPYYSIDHSSRFSGCWSSSSFSARALVFKGNVLTTKGHTVLSHDLSRREIRAEVNMDEGGTENCCGYWPGDGPVPAENVAEAPTKAKLPLASSASLRRTYSSCEELAPDLEVVANVILNQTISRHVENWQYSRFPPPRPFASPNIASGSGRNPIPTDEDSYGTNLQVEGVDEPDFVKSDGAHVWIVYGHEIVKLDATQAIVVSRTEIPSMGGTRGNIFNHCDSKDRIVGMLLIGDRLVVMTVPSSCFWYRGGPLGRDDDNTNILSTDMVTVIVYDNASMGILAIEKMQGGFINARAVKDNVHLITSSYLNYYAPLLRHFDPWNSRYQNVTTASDYETAARLEAKDRVAAFVEQMADEVDCEALQQITLMQDTDEISKDSSYFSGMSHIHSFDVTSLRGTLSSVNVVHPSSSWEVYASQDQLVLSTRVYRGGDAVKEETYLLTYKLDGHTATFQALAKVPGSVLNQFSLDEHNGYLRVATTTSAVWKWDEEARESVLISDSTSQVTVLEITDNELVEAGQVTGLGKERETIQSVRFIGDRGFVVTFERTDPLYTLDLSKPADPNRLVNWRFLASRAISIKCPTT